MHFGLTEEQDLLQQTVRDFAANELPPARLREIFETRDGHDPSLWSGMAEIGILGLMVPERFGGVDLSLLDLALVFEVLGESALPGPFLGHALATLAVARGGSDVQREQWLPRLASGETLGTVALAEAGGRWEPAAFTARADGGKVIGSKLWVEHGEAADLLVVGVAGGGFVLVERDQPEVRSTFVDGVDRTRRLASIELAGARGEALAGDSDGVADLVRDAGCVLAAADAFGAAWKMIHMTVDYTLSREQFGTPLAQFQAVKHALANLATETEPMRGLYWYAAHAFDHIADEREESAAIAKAHITDRAVAVGRSAVELHGGIGFTWECDLQFWLKRAMFDRTWGGAPRLHRERLAQLREW